MAVHRPHRLVGVRYALAQTPDQRPELLGHGVADSIGNVDGLRSLADHGLENAAQEVELGSPGVLGRELDIVGELAREAHGVDRLGVHLVGRHPQLFFHVDRRGGDEGVDASLLRRLDRLRSALDVAVVGARKPAHGAVLDDACDRPDRLEVPWAGRGEAGFDHVHAHALQLPRDAQLLFLGHRRAWALLPVAHGGVEYDQLVFHGDAPCSSRCNEASVSPKMLRCACWRCEPGTAELGLEYLAREAQQQSGEKQAAEVKLQRCAEGMHARNIAGFPGYRNCEGRLARLAFLQAQCTYPEKPYATNSRNSTTGGSVEISTNARTISRTTTKGTARRRLMSLKLRKGTLTTMVIPAKIVRRAASHGNPNALTGILLSLASQTKPATSAAAAGLGRPWKKRLSTTWMFVLNRASLKAAATQNTRAGIHPTRPSSFSAHSYTTSAGAAPKHTMSESESYSAPKALCVCVSRATRPSSPSRIIATKIAAAAFSKL